MDFLKRFILSFIFLVVFVGCNEDNFVDTVIDTPIEVLDASVPYEANDVSYGDHERQKFDLYLPANRNTGTKTMILIHGGGWTSGDKSDMNVIKELFKQNIPNLALVNMNYRLADENNKPYPMQIEDITSLVNFLKESKVNYTISEDIGFTGTSAGAHLSLLWSYAFDSNSKVDMVCSIVGPTNLKDPAYLSNSDPALEELLDLYLADTSLEFLEEVSPLHQATATAPPTILFYGGQDPLIPTTQGTDLRDKLQLLGVTNEFTLYPNAGHGWTDAVLLLDTWTKLKAFTETYL
ncbi:alpha/beta hydrolase [Hyunsoonleella sp. SJ7]|uniref:Alpha/beta hydrolase n=1 Tax=Hyunsoonleella aquatilis TaxID=2762758 RepID=A0A923KKV0_9FLAO|nr:alpha/beta hydrolase [Hyunsoonleella aquatilis]MBC3758872.1 alpha/beta hydrolase [Hyunsoonleella aquatilis]